MSWLRLDDNFASNPKIAALTDRELRVWMRVLCYCAQHQDPTVDRVVLNEVSGLGRSTLARFCELNLLDQSGADYEVHDWVHYQPKDSTGAERQARWRARRNAKRNGESNGESNDSSRDETVSLTRGRARVPVPSSKDGTKALHVAAPNGAAPPTSETPAAAGYTTDEAKLIQAAEHWIRTEGVALDAPRIYRRLVDDFAIRWPEEQDRLIRLAEQLTAAA